jgi:hypothetical protein
MVTGTGLGAAREKKTPVKSMRVAGPAACFISNVSINNAETICT